MIVHRTKNDNCMSSQTVSSVFITEDRNILKEKNVKEPLRCEGLLENHDSFSEWLENYEVVVRCDLANKGLPYQLGYYPKDCKTGIRHLSNRQNTTSVLQESKFYCGKSNKEALVTSKPSPNRRSYTITKRKRPRSGNLLIGGCAVNYNWHISPETNVSNLQIIKPI